MAKAQDFDSVDIPGRDDTPRISDLVTQYKYPDGKYGTVRFIGGLYAYGGHWVKTKKKDGGSASFYTLCSAWDPETSKFDSTKECAWCANSDSQLMGERTISKSVEYYSNVIDRKAQRAGAPDDATAPTKKEVASGFITKDSDTWTPVKACRCTPNVVKQIKGLKDLNIHEDAEGNTVGFSVSHPKYGMDVSLKYDSKAPSPSAAYSVQRGDASPLKKSEKTFLIWDLNDLLPIPSEEDVQKSYDDWLKRNGGKAAAKGKKAHDEDEDEDDVPAKKKKKVVEDDDFDEDEDEPAPKKKKKVVEEDDDDLDEDDDEPAPKKKAASKKKVVEDDDFDEDEDDEPAPKKKAAPKKKVVEDDDDDLDEDDDPKPKKKPAAKKKVVEDDDLDEDEDEPKPKKKPAAKKKVVEDDDFDEDDDEPVAKKKPAAKKKAVEEEEDEDDEPAPKKKKAPLKKKKVVDEDEDEDDL
jgi:hypothetical protein